jgi:Arc/MetJ family transcription regulator
MLFSTPKRLEMRTTVTLDDELMATAANYTGIKDVRR